MARTGKAISGFKIVDTSSDINNYPCFGGNGNDEKNDEESHFAGGRIPLFVL